MADFQSETRGTGPLSLIAERQERIGEASRANLTHEAYVLIKREIMSNELPPGSQSMETDIAERLGISRTPVREALIKLAEEGLIEVRPRRGMRVLPISTAEMRDIYDLLQILEPECAATLARDRLSAEQVEKLAAAVRDMESALDAGKLDRWAKADDRFHRLHLEFTRNRRLARIIGGLLDQAHRARMFTLKLREMPRQSTADHKVMVELLQEGDVRRVRAIYRRHRRLAARELFDILERYELHRL